LYSALAAVWNTMKDFEIAISDYLRSSKLREAMETISIEFSKSGLDLPRIPDSDVPPEKYEEEFQKFINKIFGARSGSSQ
ncbi:MAG: hypothetical protein WCC06_10500, partial [Candidatus Aminicenantales bacterium]